MSASGDLSEYYDYPSLFRDQPLLEVVDKFVGPLKKVKGYANLFAWAKDKGLPLRAKELKNRAAWADPGQQYTWDALGRYVGAGASAIGGFWKSYRRQLSKNPNFGGFLQSPPVKAGPKPWPGYYGGKAIGPSRKPGSSVPLLEGITASKGVYKDWTPYYSKPIGPERPKSRGYITRRMPRNRGSYRKRSYYGGKARAKQRRFARRRRYGRRRKYLAPYGVRQRNARMLDRRMYAAQAFMSPAKFRKILMQGDPTGMMRFATRMPSRWGDRRLGGRSRYPWIL